MALDIKTIFWNGHRFASRRNIGINAGAEFAYLLLVANF